MCTMCRRPITISNTRKKTWLEFLLSSKQFFIAVKMMLVRPHQRLHSCRNLQIFFSLALFVVNFRFFHFYNIVLFGVCILLSVKYFVWVIDFIFIWWVWQLAPPQLFDNPLFIVQIVFTIITIICFYSDIMLGCCHYIYYRSLFVTFDLHGERFSCKCWLNLRGQDNRQTKKTQNLRGNYHSFAGEYEMETSENWFEMFYPKKNMHTLSNLREESKILCFFLSIALLFALILYYRSLVMRIHTRQ